MRFCTKSQLDRRAARRAVGGAFAGIWLKAATPEYDLVGGGITILDSRRRDAEGEEKITFTSGHITFRQSLLARAEDAEALDSYDKLTSEVRVGALPGTTGEARLLQITGLADDQGVLAAGARIDTPQGSLVADGSADFLITAAMASPNLIDRLHLHPPVATMPQVIYLGSELGERELLEALENGQIDALARGEIGNQDAAHYTGEAFVVAALDDATENGGFTLSLETPELASCLDEKINWLTDSRQIAYADWLNDPTVFMARAETWNERQAQSD